MDLYFNEFKKIYFSQSINASFEKSCKKKFFNSISQKRSPYYEEVTKLIPFVLMSFMLGSFFYSLCNFSYIQLERSCICSSLGTNALHSISLIPQTRDSNVTHKTTEFLRNKQDRSQWHFWTTLLFCIAPRVRPEPGFGKVENI